MKIINQTCRNAFLIFDNSGKFENFVYTKSEAEKLKSEGKKIFFVSAGDKKNIIIRRK
jgi:hypothetical protein